jgi:hypothetical protein
MKSLLIVATLIISLGFVSTSVHATLLTGKTVHGEYLFPDINTQFQDLGNVTGGSGVFTDLGFIPNINLFVYDAQLKADYSAEPFGTVQWYPISFNGFHIDDVNNTIPDFTSVTINSQTNMVGFDASRISFDANNIWVNWENLFFDATTLVVLDITGGPSTVPEPSTFILLGAGLGGLALLRRRAKK